jgi:hypothetical protein
MQALGTGKGLFPLDPVKENMDLNFLVSSQQVISYLRPVDAIQLHSAGECE